EQLAERRDELLKERFDVVPYFIRTRIRAVKRRQLEVWLDRLDGATRLEDVLGRMDSLGFGRAHRQRSRRCRGVWRRNACRPGESMGSDPNSYSGLAMLAFLVMFVALGIRSAPRVNGV